MLKKLQNLLFEDEDDDEEEEAEEEKAEENVLSSAPAAPAQSVQQETPAAPVQPSIQRIDVVKPASPLSENIQDGKKQTLGITVDDISEKKEEPKKPKQASVQKKSEPKKPEKKKQSAYEFKPVISPIFGVDEKDVNALKTTNQRITRQEREKDRQDANITPIISPMYGPEASSNGARSIEDSVSDSDDSLKEAPSEPADDLPDFSLDDILKSRDQEFENNRKAKEEKPAFPDLEDEPLPEVAQEDMKPAEEDDDFFPDLKFDDDEVEDDTTSVIEKPDIEKNIKK